MKSFLSLFQLVFRDHFYTYMYTYMFSAVISEHFSKNRMIIYVVGAKIWYLKNVQFLLGHPVYSISVENLYSISFGMNFTDINHFSISLSFSCWNITGLCGPPSPYV